MFIPKFCFENSKAQDLLCQIFRATTVQAPPKTSQHHYLHLEVYRLRGAIKAISGYRKEKKRKCAKDDRIEAVLRNVVKKEIVNAHALGDAKLLELEE